MPCHFFDQEYFCSHFLETAKLSISEARRGQLLADVYLSLYIQLLFVIVYGFVYAR